MIKINFFGDLVMQDASVKLDERLADILNDGDLNVINMEAPINTTCQAILKSGPSIHQSAFSSAWMKKYGFSCVSLSNNHMYDFGTIGLDDTIQSLDGLNTFGAGTWESAYSIREIIIQKKKIGLLGLTHNEYGALTNKFDRKYEKGCAWINHPCVDVIIAQERDKYDYLFIIAHAGVEHFTQPLPEWRERYRAFIDLGVDGVIASHPHIPQGWEEYKKKPIFYSLGNFCFQKGKEKLPSYWNQSLCAKIMLGDDIMKWDVFPLDYIPEKKMICVSESKAFQDYLHEINAILANDDIYLTYINKQCDNLLSEYYKLFASGGLTRLYPVSVLLKTVVRYFTPNKMYKQNIVNNLQNESHRWCILRALNNQIESKSKN